MTPRFPLCSDPEPRLASPAQHEEQDGEQDGGRGTEEDAHGCDLGPAGSAGGENQQDPRFPREQAEGLSGGWIPSSSAVSS